MNKEVLNKMSDEEIVSIVQLTVEEYLSVEYRQTPCPPSMDQLESLMDCLEYRVGIQEQLDPEWMKNVLMTSDRSLMIDLANRLGVTLKDIGKCIERSTNNEESWSTTKSYGSAKQAPDSIKKSGQVPKVNRDRTPSIGPSEVEEFQITEGNKLTATKQRSSKSIPKETLPENDETIPEGKKHARAYPTSQKPSATQDEERQIKHAVEALKNLMVEKKITLVDANVLVMAKIAERNRETQNQSGSNDTKVLLAAVQRLIEAGVE